MSLAGEWCSTALTLALHLSVCFQIVRNWRSFSYDLRSCFLFCWIGRCRCSSIHVFLSSALCLLSTRVVLEVAIAHGQLRLRARRRWKLQGLELEALSSKCGSSSCYKSASQFSVCFWRPAPSPFHFLPPLSIGSAGNLISLGMHRGKHVCV